MWVGEKLKGTIYFLHDVGREFFSLLYKPGSQGLSVFNFFDTWPLPAYFRYVTSITIMILVGGNGDVSI